MVHLFRFGGYMKDILHPESQKAVRGYRVLPHAAQRAGDFYTAQSGEWVRYDGKAPIMEIQNPIWVRTSLGEQDELLLGTLAKFEGRIYAWVVKSGKQGSWFLLEKRTNAYRDRSSKRWGETDEVIARLEELGFLHTDTPPLGPYGLTEVGLGVARCIAGRT